MDFPECTQLDDIGVRPSVRDVGAHSRRHRHRPRGLGAHALVSVHAESGHEYGGRREALGQAAAKGREREFLAFTPLSMEARCGARGNLIYS